MSHFVYLISLLIGIGGLIIIDHRLKLAFFHDARKTARVIATSMALFIVWDIAGIMCGIFRHGNGPFNLAFVIAPEFPLEELFFLFLLSYTALLLYLGASKRWPRT